MDPFPAGVHHTDEQRQEQPVSEAIRNVRTALLRENTTARMA